MARPLFELTGISKHYQGRQVLSIDWLTISTGGITALQGHNGSGKSTLLRILALLLKPDRGRLEFEGREAGNGAADLVALRRRITLVAQDAYLFQGSVAKNLAYGLKQRGVAGPERERALALALATVGLAGFAKRKARELSGGEAQRVALARALVLKPQVLLLDEPFASLDPASSDIFETVIAGLPERGTSVILVTHAAQQALRLAGRVITLQEGRVINDRPGAAA